MGNKSNRDKSLIELLITPAITASGISTEFLPENSKELCDGIELLQQQKPARKNSDINSEKIIATVDNLSEYKLLSRKQHKFLLLKRLN